MRRQQLLGRLLVISVLSVVALIAAPASPAAAAGSWVAVGEPTCISAGCQIARGHQTGSYAKDTKPIQFRHSTGVLETFVIGTDATHSVYHTWQRYVGDPIWTPWTRIGGVVGRYGPFAKSSTPTIRVQDNIGANWCISGPAWSTWIAC